MNKQQLKDAVLDRFPVPALFEALFVLVVIALSQGASETIVNWMN